MTQHVACQEIRRLIAILKKRPCAEANHSTMMYEPDASDTMDVPFLKNDMNDALPTTGWPLDVSDAPGKADSELFEADEIVPSSSK
jgi:hypothetical protein